MGKEVKHVSIYGSRRQDGHVSDICRLIDALRARDIEVFVHTKLGLLLGEEGYRLPLHGVKAGAMLPEATDVAVSIGGDGTFLRTARWLGGREIPIVGINTGHLGFLAENSVDDTDRILSLLCEDKGVVEKRMVLEAVCDKIPPREWPYALNEVAFLKGDSASMISVSVEADGYFLADYRADGLLMATPTGSTAYNLSVGGPILAPTLNNIILAPIAPHTLTLRPVVIGGDSELTATVHSRKGDFRLSIDGRSFTLPCDSTVKVRKASHSVLTLLHPDENFASTLRNKLFWGHS